LQEAHVLCVGLLVLRNLPSVFGRNRWLGFGLECEGCSQRVVVFSVWTEFTVPTGKRGANTRRNGIGHTHGSASSKGVKLNGTSSSVNLCTALFAWPK
jgi:hypothetical protein